MRLSLRCWVGIGHRRWRQGSVAVACESLRGGAAVWIMRAAGLRARTMKDCIVPRSRVGPSASRRWTGAVGRRWCECCRGPPEHRRAVERRCWRFGKVSYHTGHRLAFHKTLACTFGGGAASGQRRQRDGGTHCPVPWFWRRAQGPHSGTAVRGSPPRGQAKATNRQAGTSTRRAADPTTRLAQPSTAHPTRSCETNKKAAFLASTDRRGARFGGGPYYRMYRYLARRCGEATKQLHYQSSAQSGIESLEIEWVNQLDGGAPRLPIRLGWVSGR